MLPGGWCASRGGGVLSGGSVCFWGVCFLGGVCVLGMRASRGGGIPACTEADPPCGQNHRHE